MTREEAVAFKCRAEQTIPGKLIIAPAEIDYPLAKRIQVTGGIDELILSEYTDFDVYVVEETEDTFQVRSLTI